MAQTLTHIFRVSLMDDANVYRDIEIASSASLYDLAHAIVASFKFNLDHAFGFYNGKTPGTLFRSRPKYELFADIGEETDAQGVEQTTVATAFPRPRRRMTFLFDYGDQWLFQVILTGTGKKMPGTRYPKVLATQGNAPKQYPNPDDPDEE